MGLLNFIYFTKSKLIEIVCKSTLTGLDVDAIDDTEAVVGDCCEIALVVTLFVELFVEVSFFFYEEI